MFMDSRRLCEQYVRMDGLGIRLRERAVALGLSDAEVARRAGIGVRRYSNYVTDSREPDFETLLKICDVLGISPNDALGVAPTPRAHPDGGAVAKGEEFALVPVLDVSASAGDGGHVEREDELHRVAFHRTWLRDVTSAPHTALKVIQVDGDSMWPTLAHGDHVLVDTTQTEARREGLYVFRRDGELQVKRVSPHPETGLLKLTSDNSAYPSYDNIDPTKVSLLGRIIWAGRRL